MNEWKDAFGEVPASFEARMRDTLASLEEDEKIRHFRFRPGMLAAAVLLVVGRLTLPYAAAHPLPYCGLFILARIVPVGSVI